MEGSTPLPITQPHQSWFPAPPRVKEKNSFSLDLSIREECKGERSKLKAGGDGPEGSPGLP